MKKILLISLIFIWISCSNKDSNSKYLRWVGDSEFEVGIDTIGFEPCNSEYRIKQYFHLNGGLHYKGEKIQLFKEFSENYSAVNNNQSGWIRIRFIVNCHGKTGRFRIIGSDENYKEIEFDEKIINQLMKITMSLDGWMKKTLNEKPIDYYQYIVFKIVNGNLVEIMP